MKTPNRIRSTTIYSLLLISLSCAKQGGPLTVCEVLSDLSHYQGKSIAIRGIFDGGTHGWKIVENFDWKPCSLLEKQGHTWPPAICLRVYPGDMPKIDAILAESIKVVHDENFNKNAPMLSVVATFTGKLEYQENVEITRTTDGWYKGNGYGQDGEYRASLIIKDVQDVKVAKNYSTASPGK